MRIRGECAKAVDYTWVDVFSTATASQLVECKLKASTPFPQASKTHKRTNVNCLSISTGAATASDLSHARDLEIRVRPDLALGSYVSDTTGDLTCTTSAGAVPDSTRPLWGASLYP